MATCSLHGPLCHHNHAPRVGRRQVLKGFAAGAALVSTGGWLSGCATNPATGQSTLAFGSLDDDVALGRQEHPKLVAAFGGEYENQRLSNYVTQLGNSLAAKTELPGLPYRFTVLNTPIVNAMALPGGFIYLTRGLLALGSNEAEVAGVLGHEIGHVVARHTAQRQAETILAQIGLVVLGVATGVPQLVQLAQIGAVGMLQKHSREQELEADTLGVRYMTRNGYDPDGMVTFLASLREYSQLEAQLSGQDPGVVDEYNWLATHPRTLDRVQLAMSKAEAARPDDPLINRDLYLNQINGMIYGDDPRQGIIDGNRFRHPDLRFEFIAPEGFRLFNSQENVTAQHPQGAGFVFDMADSSSGDMADYLVNEWASDVSLNDVERLDINGMEAATGWTRADGRNGPVDLRGLAIQGDSGKVFRFLFVSPSNQRGWGDAFRITTYSFRRLSSAEAKQIHGFNLIVVPSRSGDTVAALSRTMPFGRHNETAFRVLNDLVGGGNPEPGGLVKVVTS